MVRPARVRFHRSGLSGSTFGTELRDDGRPVRAGDVDDLIARGAERGRFFVPFLPPADRDGPGVATLRPRRRPSRAIGGVGQVVVRAHLFPLAGASSGVMGRRSVPFEVTADRAGVAGSFHHF